MYDCWVSCLPHLPLFVLHCSQFNERLLQFSTTRSKQFLSLSSSSPRQVPRICPSNYNLPPTPLLDGTKFLLNPGLWNIQKHVLVYIMANVVTGPPYALNAIVATHQACLLVQRSSCRRQPFWVSRTPLPPRIVYSFCFYTHLYYVLVAK